MITSEKTLNEGQKKAAEGFFDFLLDNNAKELCISGPGGVGKTFLMGHLIDTIMPQYIHTCQMMGIRQQYKEVMMTATTNKAADVLGLASGRHTQTTCSFFNLKVKENYKTGISELERSRGWKPKHDSIIFVDEASMVDSDLLEEIRGATVNCKIVYVGDHCQLAPVAEPFSPVYRQNLPFYELTEPMRNADRPALQELCTQLRETVKTKNFGDIKLEPGVIDFVSGDDLQAELDIAFCNIKHNNRLMAYTNSRVLDFNDYIREMRGITEVYVDGETLVNNNLYESVGGNISVEQMVTLSNLTEREIVTFEDGADLEVLYADLTTQYGETFTGVPLPTDRAHYTSLVNFYKKNKKWAMFYHLKNRYPDLRQPDASTVHKAQGSSYDTAFVDLGNISTCHNPDQVARMLYVAISRARSRVVLFGDLASKYGKVLF